MRYLKDNQIFDFQNVLTREEHTSFLAGTLEGVLIGVYYGSPYQIFRTLDGAFIGFPHDFSTPIAGFVHQTVDDFYYASGQFVSTLNAFENAQLAYNQASEEERLQAQIALENAQDIFDVAQIDFQTTIQFLQQAQMQAFHTGELQGVFIAFAPIYAPISVVNSRAEIEALAQKFIDEDFTASGQIYLLKAQTKLELLGADNSQSPYHLPYKMIAAVEYWIKKVWTQYNVYKQEFEATEYLGSIDYESVAGSPPCSFNDIRWVLEPDEYRLFEPDRQVNTDLNYYLNYLT